MEKKQKYKKGDKAWCPTIEWSDKWITCPDCIGDKQWMICFPSGQVEYVECQTCRIGFDSATGQLNIKMWRPKVGQVTVGSVRYDDSKDEPYEYMCEETGIGSGRLYRDIDLFDSKEEAEKVAQEKYEEQQLSIAKNNFKSKKDIERMLSTYGYTRSTLPQITQDFMKWIGLAKRSNRNT